MDEGNRVDVACLSLELGPLVVESQGLAPGVRTVVIPGQYTGV